MYQKILVNLFLLTVLCQVNAFAQATIYGRISDENNEPVVGATIIDVDNISGGTSADIDGNYELSIDEDRPVKVEFRAIGKKDFVKVVTLGQNEKRLLNITLEGSLNELEGVVIDSDRGSSSTVAPISVQSIEQLPTTTMNIEDVLKTLGPVVSNNELSSQYSVRGGNYDENLVYVNDYEIFRPFLIRSGQQEGLSFVNADMVSSLGFSAGGFQAKYGDKMSSVLDVKYKRPSDFGGSLQLSLLGASLNLEGRTLGGRLGYLVGYRNKSNSYLLNSQPIKGAYNPTFTDFQTYLKYDLTPNWEWDFIANYASNKFSFIPNESSSNFGTFNQTLNLYVLYQGQEEDAYSTGMGGTGLSYHTNDNRLRLKFMTSAFNTREIEAFDIVGYYALSQTESSLDRDADLGAPLVLLGSGGFHDYARNKLNATIFNVSHKGFLTLKKNKFREGKEDNTNEHLVSWGMKFQNEDIVDQLNEWGREDSADYTIPQDNSQLKLKEVLKTTLTLNSNRYSGFLQDEWTLGKEAELSMTGGVRMQYWDLNKELIVTPRFQIAYRPLRLINRFNQAIDDTDAEETREVDKDLILRFAGGAYYQPAFYREMRDSEGTINRNLRSQKSLHAVLGAEYTFNMWKRPFKFTAEMYYKSLWDLVPYDLDNLLIRYYAQNLSKGYAAGVDLRLNGEFVPGTDSWISLSLMQTKEDIEGDHFYAYFNEGGQNIYNSDTIVFDQVVVDSARVDIGSLHRPTDQRMTFAMFFQDYLPNRKNFKTHLTLIVGSGTPFGPPGIPQARSQFRLNVYRRVDIGFSALLFDKFNEDRELPERSFLRHLENVWVSLEVFNLLGVANQVSASYFKAYSNDFRREQIYLVPNYLTARRLNVRLKVKF